MIPLSDYFAVAKSSALDLSLLTCAPGVYTLHDGHDYFYVGQTIDLRERMKVHLGPSTHVALTQHIKANTCKVFFVEVADRAARRELEQALIYELRPRFNRKKILPIPKGIPEDCQRILLEYMAKIGTNDWRKGLPMFFNEAARHLL